MKIEEISTMVRENSKMKVQGAAQKKGDANTSTAANLCAQLQQQAYNHKRKNILLL